MDVRPHEILLQISIIITEAKAVNTCSTEFFHSSIEIFPNFIEVSISFIT